MQCYIVDTFSDRIFGGNPAAVCVLHDKWLPDRLMQTIAKEHNLSETAFVFVKMARINYVGLRQRTKSTFVGMPRSQAALLF